MNFVIDPRVFYWINTMNRLKILCGVAGGILTAGFVFAVLGYIYNLEICIEYKNEHRPTIYENHKKYMVIARNASVICGILGLLLLTASVFIPDKETGIQMLVAKTATFNNLDWTATQVKEMIDYVVKAIKSIQN